MEKEKEKVLEWSKGQAKGHFRSLQLDPSRPEEVSSGSEISSFLSVQKSDEDGPLCYSEAGSSECYSQGSSLASGHRLAAGKSGIMPLPGAGPPVGGFPTTGGAAAPAGYPTHAVEWRTDPGMLAWPAESGAGATGSGSLPSNSESAASHKALRQQELHRTTPWPAATTPADQGVEEAPPRPSEIKKGIVWAGERDDMREESTTTTATGGGDGTKDWSSSSLILIHSAPAGSHEEDVSPSARSSQTGGVDTAAALGTPPGPARVMGVFNRLFGCCQLQDGHYDAAGTVRPEMRGGSFHRIAVPSGPEGEEVEERPAFWTPPTSAASPQPPGPRASGAR